MIAPYFPNDDWEIILEKRHNTLFMAEDKFPDYGSDSMAQRLTYYGYKFEALCTSKSEIVDTNTEFCSVFTSKFGNITCLLGGEVDCFIGDSREYIELKTNRLICNQRQKKNFES